MPITVWIYGSTISNIMGYQELLSPESRPFSNSILTNYSLYVKDVYFKLGIYDYYAFVIHSYIQRVNWTFQIMWEIIFLVDIAIIFPNSAYVLMQLSFTVTLLYWLPLKNNGSSCSRKRTIPNFGRICLHFIFLRDVLKCISQNNFQSQNTTKKPQSYWQLLKWS